MPAIHQFLPTFAPHDAIGNHAVAIRGVLRELGIDSEIYADGRAGTDGRDFRSFKGGAGSRILYHASTGSPVAEFVRERDEPLVVDYHNITPASFFAPWEPHVGVELDAGRRQLHELASRATLGLADSEYNRRELEAAGFRSSIVVPILVDTHEFDRPIARATLDRLRGETGVGAAWLFVGRVAPHKAQHDIVKAFAVYRRTYDAAARLRLVGSPASHRYAAALAAFIAELGVAEAVDLVGDVSDGDLGAHYAAADVLVVLSDHEGFNVPLLEAMHHGLPIVAYDAAAVPETLGAGGLCLPRKDPSLVAAAVHRVVSDAALRSALIDAGRRRLEDFQPARTRATLVDAIEGMLAA